MDRIGSDQLIPSRWIQSEYSLMMRTEMKHHSRQIMIQNLITRDNERLAHMPDVQRKQASCDSVHTGARSKERIIPLSACILTFVDVYNRDKSLTFSGPDKRFPSSAMMVRL
jgi:hypothetical protein